MRSTLKTMALAGLLAIGGLAMSHALAQAGCGGGGYRNTGGYGGGHTFGGSYYGGRGGGCGGGCGMSGMAMPGMNMGAYAPAPSTGYAHAAYPQATPQPAAAAGQYSCPMHPSVVSATPGSCPYCHMALQRR